jgi:hypothetical protein
LLVYAKSREMRLAADVPVGAGLREVWGRMKSWFQGNF